MQIHDLNDFVGALGSGAFIPVDNGQDTGKLSFADMFGADTTVTLASGSTLLQNAGDSVSLADDPANYEFVDIYYKVGGCRHFIRIPTDNGGLALQFIIDGFESTHDTYYGLDMWRTQFRLNSSNATVQKVSKWAWDGDAAANPTYTEDTTGSLTSGLIITRIDGIKTPANSKGVIAVRQATLAANGWSSNTQTVTVADVTTTNNVIISADPASISEYNSCGVYCSAQATDSLTFICSTTPANDLTVNVMLIGQPS